MTVLLAIDPGPVQSAWVTYDNRSPVYPIRSFAITENEQFRNELYNLSSSVTIVAIEQVRSYGMSVGAEVFDTVWWAGRFAEVATAIDCEVAQITRLEVKKAVCHDGHAKDSNIRQALIDRFGGPNAIRKGGSLYKVSKDVWAALAVAVTWVDREAATA